MKHTILISISILGLCLNVSLLAAESPADLSKGLIGYWKFDETNGDQVKDSSRGANHGALQGAVRAAGKFGGAIECKKDALVVVPNSGFLSEMKEGITVAAWVNWATNSSWNMIVSREIKGGTSEYFGLAIVKNKALFSVDPDGAHNRKSRSTTVPWPNRKSSRSGT
jgi:hypothetical protein